MAIAGIGRPIRFVEGVRDPTFRVGKDGPYVTARVGPIVVFLRGVVGGFVLEMGEALVRAAADTSNTLAPVVDSDEIGLAGMIGGVGRVRRGGERVGVHDEWRYRH